MQQQNIFAFEDHLDGILSTCEDQLNRSAQSTDPALLTTSLRVLELSTAMILLQARQRASDLRITEPRLATEATHFLAVTASTEQARRPGNRALSGVLPGTQSSRAQEHRCKAAHYAVEMSLAGPEIGELWQIVRSSCLRLAATEELKAALEVLPSMKPTQSYATASDRDTFTGFATNNHVPMSAEAI